MPASEAHRSSIASQLRAIPSTIETSQTHTEPLLLLTPLTMLSCHAPHVRCTQPSVRVVLLKGFDSRGFVFYTNYTRWGRHHSY
jgi:hypothetical protein